MLRRRWWLIVLPAAVGLLLALPALPGMIRPPVSYSVVMRFTASQPPPPQGATFEEQSYIPWLASEYAVINLAAWARTESFGDEVAVRLKANNVPVEAAALRGAFAADSVRSILTLYVAWPDGAQIVPIAEAASAVLRERGGAYFPQFGAAGVSITALDGVSAAPVGVPITTRLAPLLRILIGLAAGLGLAFLAEYLDPTLRTRREAEALGLPVIAEIPG
jgi:hypothetical protein